VRYRRRVSRQRLLHEFIGKMALGIDIAEQPRCG
jgi:hypothetical protein